MKSLSVRYVIALLVACSLLSQFSVTGDLQLFAQTKDAISLFDGKSLDGWEGDPGHWRVESGAIVGEIPVGTTLDHNTWLVWNGGSLEDFDLRLQFKLTGAVAANSGIQFRCQVDSVDHVSGYQADLDMGAVWLGRIYDEHGRGLLVERGSRVEIGQDGNRKVQTFAPLQSYGVLFRQGAWNDYRIVAQGDRVSVYVNGTLFSELQDSQADQKENSGSLALQLHSGPETRVEFRDIRLEALNSSNSRLAPFLLAGPVVRQKADQVEDQGKVPEDSGVALNLGFEKGVLEDWTATGDAFSDQPINQDGISSRWPAQVSNKDGDFFIAGYEKVQDRGQGTLTSRPFAVTHPFASFRIGGGQANSTRVELLVAEGKNKAEVIFSATGEDREQMRQVAVDLQQYQGQSIAIRLVDENEAAWGHLNFDDFRFHSQRPVSTQPVLKWRSTANPILQHLVSNQGASGSDKRGNETANQMFVPKGFSVDVIAAEPELHQPMAFTFDAKGRLWVVEGYSYPQKRPQGEGLDRILIFSDEDGDGTFETRKIFTQGLNLVSGMEVGHGGVWVGAAPDLLFIPDRDGDDVPDSEPIVLLDGFGLADTHETLNSFMWGPDGWLYGNQGVFNSSMIGKPGVEPSQRQAMRAGVWRYHPKKHQFEVFAHGGSNQWGLDYDQHGQIFMTHCRSYWGRGSTTHVIQGGNYWNQVNSGYLPFVSSTSIDVQPAMKNFMLASARYGHGEGGAGKVGSRQVYGGHSHVGTMIYLGDNWPDQYRNHLFSHNLHGHQMNQQVNLREDGGYNTVHAGQDVLFCADQQYIGVDLKVGPDGAVYLSDWYDPRHCHNPDWEQWDRGNGRMYRMKFDATFQPVSIDYIAASDLQLVGAQNHANDWHARAARLEMSHRSSQRAIDPSAISQLQAMATSDEDETRRLRAIWCLHEVGSLDWTLTKTLATDPSEYVRSWVVQLSVESLPSQQVSQLLMSIAQSDSSLMVRRYLASSITRLPDELGWKIATQLSQQQENSVDRELPLLLWYAVAKLMESDLPRGIELADQAKLSILRDYAYWYAAKLSDQGRAIVAARLAAASGPEQYRLLRLFELAIQGMRGLQVPEDWTSVAADLYRSTDRVTVQAAHSLGAAFGDELLFQQMRKTLVNSSAGIEAKKYALSILLLDSSPGNGSLLLPLLDQGALRKSVLPMLIRFDDLEIANHLLQRMPGWDDADRAAAMEVLCSRVSWAHWVLEATDSGVIPKSDLTAFFVRQIANLGNADLNQKLEQQWGKLSQSSQEQKAAIGSMVAEYKSAPLWAYSGAAGAGHFKQLCATCHQDDPGSERIAPRLEGSGSKGIDYVVENIVQPNAVIGRDFQARIILTVQGRVISGLVVNQTDSALTIRTASATETIAMDDIEEVKVSENSFMPEGLLNTLNQQQRIELFKYLMSL